METTEITREYLPHFFGDLVTIEHFDMANDEARGRCQHLIDSVPEGYLYYPLVFVNDELRVVASAEYFEILAAVRQEIELQTQSQA